ncbi:hypothetical protein A9995_04460 [Erythrobacter sp. QSSC1-22B]|nr:hypothetical protein A9995_04460 [Erythrobacter sp. QSSC1-22B]
MLLDQTSDRLTVGCTSVLPDEHRIALEFATGLQIQTHHMHAEEIDACLAKFGSPTFSLHGSPRNSHGKPETRQEQVPLPHDRKSQHSLTDLAGAFLQSLAAPSPAAWAPLSELLEAGYSPKEAGDVLLRPDHLAPALDPVLIELAGRLADGVSLGEAVTDNDLIPRWLRLSLAAIPNEAGQAAALICFSAFERTIVARSGEARAVRLEAAMLWLPVVLAWYSIENGAGMAFAALASAGFFWLRSLTASDRRSDTIRGRIFGMVHLASEFELPPSASVRIATASLDAAYPTWGMLPDTRKGLADALALPPVSRAVLMKGGLAASSARLETLYEERRIAQLDRARWLVRTTAAGLFGTALVLLVAQ